MSVFGSVCVCVCVCVFCVLYCLSHFTTQYDHIVPLENVISNKKTIQSKANHPLPNSPEWMKGSPDGTNLNTGELGRAGGRFGGWRDGDD